MKTEEVDSENAGDRFMGPVAVDDDERAYHRWTSDLPASGLVVPPTDLDSLMCPDRPTDRAALLFAVRESDAHDWIQMEGMVGQTYAGLPNHPIARALRTFGMTPMHGKPFDITISFGGEVGDVTVSVVPEVRVSGRTKAVFFRIGDTYHLWCMASAAKVTNIDRMNDWNRILIDVLHEIRPMLVHVATISRLIRSQDQAYDLYKALSATTDALSYGGIVLHNKGPRAFESQMVLMIMGLMAAQERDLIMQRLMAGRVALFARGLWPFGRSFVPYGYSYDKETRLLSVDESTVAITPKVIDVLLENDLPQRALLKLAEVGVTMRRSKDADGKLKPISHSRNAFATVELLVSAASVYVFGQYVVRIGNPGLNCEHIAGVPVVRNGGSDPGELQMVVSLPLPDGGWGTQAQREQLWQLALAYAARTAERGRGPRPLSPTLAAQYPHLDVARLTEGVEPVQVGASATEARGRARGGRAKAVLSALTGRRWTDREGRSLELRRVSGGRYRVFNVEATSRDGRIDALGG